MLRTGLSDLKQNVTYPSIDDNNDLYFNYSDYVYPEIYASALVNIYINIKNIL